MITFSTFHNRKSLEKILLNKSNLISDYTEEVFGRGLKLMFQVLKDVFLHQTQTAILC